MSICKITDLQGEIHELNFDNLQSEYINTDCISALKAMPDKCIDLAVIDPPYGINEDGSKNATRGKLAISKDYKPYVGNDKTPPDDEYFNELFRVSKHQIIWGANHFISRIPYDSHCWIVWDKENGANDFADCELAWTNFDSAVRLFRFRWSGFLQGDMKHKETRIHPNQKPVALYKWIFSRYAKPGMTFLDTHVGSASSLIAAHDMGLRFIGFELDEYYYKQSKVRLDEHTQQMNIYDVRNYE